MSFGGASGSHNPNNDAEVQNAATDGISCIEWAPSANFIVAGSWDNQIRCWEVQSNGTAVPKAATAHDGPVLACSWSNDGARVYTGSADKTAKVWDLASNQAMQCAAHDMPIRDVFWCAEKNFLVTASWDHTIKYWDGKSPTPGATLQLPERPHAVSVQGKLLVAATADRKIVIVNLQPVQTGATPPREHLPIAYSGILVGMARPCAA